MYHYFSKLSPQNARGTVEMVYGVFVAYILEDMLVENKSFFSIWFSLIVRNWKELMASRIKSRKEINFAAQ